MGAEVLGAEFSEVAVKDGNEVENTYVHEIENGKLNHVSAGQGIDEPIKFGSHGTDGPVKGEGDVKEANFPKDAVDEWPEPKQIHSFYFVKFRSYEDPKLKSKIDQVDKEIQKKNQARFQLTEAIKAKRSERAQVISQLKPLTQEDKRYRMVVEEKRREREPLQQALGKLRTASNASRERGIGLCSSEEELNERIQNLQYQIQHESNTLGEEKQLLREIKQLEGTREKVIANAAMKAKIQDSLGQKEAIEDQVKLIGLDMDGARKEQQAIRAKIKLLEEDLKAIDSEIASLQEELTALSQKRDKAYEGLVELRKQRDEGNAYFYQNRSLLNNARELAAKKDVRALEELSHSEVEKFMSQWSSSKSFRDDYEKRIIQSLDIRQLSRDGRIRNPDEKPLVPEPVAPTESEHVAKVNSKKPKDEPKPSSKHDPIPVQKTQKEENNKLVDSKASTKAIDSLEKEVIPKSEKPRNEPVAVDVVAEAKLKEMKREEEIAKAKLALERKKKLAEKSAVKAAARAQKEAEKKLKEREKRAKKKAAASASNAASEEQSEADAKAEETEPAEVNVEASVPSKTREPKENSIRFINRRQAQGGSISKKVILKRKKSTPYWVWAAPAAALLVATLMLLGCYYYYY